MTYPFIFDRNFGAAEGFGSKGLPTEIRRAGFPRPRKTGEHGEENATAKGGLRSKCFDNVSRL